MTKGSLDDLKGLAFIFKGVRGPLQYQWGSGHVEWQGRECSRKRPDQQTRQRRKGNLHSFRRIMRTNEIVCLLADNRKNGRSQHDF